MFHGIPWASYWLALLAVLIIYYLFALLYLYRPSVKPKTKQPARTFSFSDKTPALALEQEPYVPPGLQNEQALAGQDSSFELLHAELMAFLEALQASRPDKRALLDGLSLIAKKYPPPSLDIKQTCSRIIVSEAAHLCSIHLSQRDVDEVWLDR